MAGEHVAREYCVQYRETHLAFVERIAAEEGIWYYFTHGENGQHTAHFIDMPQIAAQAMDLQLEDERGWALENLKSFYVGWHSEQNTWTTIL